MSVYFQDETVTLHHGRALDVVRTLPDQSVDCVVTSPPYFGLRDYGADGQYGVEKTPAEFVENLVTLYREVRRVLADDGTFWLNLGDSYYSGKGSPTQPDRKNTARRPPARALDKPGQSWGRQKGLLGIPWRVALALQDDGWILRNDIIWNKPNAMPESVTDRLSARHEHLFLFTKSPRYWFDLDPIRETILHPDKTGHTFGGNHPEISSTRGGKYQPADKARPATGERHTGGHASGKNPGDVWSISTSPFPGAHFAVFPEEIPRRCIVAGCKPGGTVLDPCSGSGTTGAAAQANDRRYIGIDINAEYLRLSLETRLQDTPFNFNAIA